MQQNQLIYKEAWRDWLIVCVLNKYVRLVARTYVCECELAFVFV